MKVDIRGYVRICVKSLVLTGLLFWFGSYASAEFQKTGNFHQVDAGKLYRSAQLTGWDLQNYVQQYGIKSIINLRGQNPGDDWYQEEMEVVRRQGLSHVDISMSASTIPSRENLIRLLEAYKNLPRPILIHCKAGSDRTGEASALYQMIYQGKSRSQAMDMLSVKYGHVKRFKPAKDYFVEEVWQGLDWAYKNYNPCQGRYRFYDTNATECR